MGLALGTQRSMFFLVDGDGRRDEPERPATMTTSTTSSPAFLAGLKDGLAWDLDGFATAAAVQANKSGWDESTINAIGKVPCAKAWGVEADGEAWETACEDYNRGAHQGATADQAERTGLPTREG